MQLYISISVAKVLTYPEIVTEHNIDNLNRYIKNGANIYPGANSVSQNGINIRLDDTNNKIKLEPGNIVNRHIISGDFMLLTTDTLIYERGKQPLYAVVVDPKLKGAHIQKTICTPSFHADFDGDE